MIPESERPLQDSSLSVPHLPLIPHLETFMVPLRPYFTQNHFSHHLQCVRRHICLSGHGEQHKRPLVLKLYTVNEK